MGLGHVPGSALVQMLHEGGLLLCLSFVHSLNTCSYFALSSLFLCISTCFRVFVCETRFLKKQVVLGQSICICVKRLLISPVLDLDRRFQMCNSDRQQIPQA
jgi:hypothetical protein